jgi:hypothetical protein
MSVGVGRQSRILRFDVLRTLALLKSVNNGNLELKKLSQKSYQNGFVAWRGKERRSSFYAEC